MKHLIIPIAIIMINYSAQAQVWLDTNLYPFKSHYFSTPSGNIHYVDEGEGEVILFVHGTPAWSFLYRDYIAHFSNNYRCIAIDHLGFGLSDKPTNFNGTPQLHAKNLSNFIESLGLKNITLVVHDFGGPIGLAAAIQNNQRIKNVVLFNTWLWETKNNPEALKVDKILNSWMGKFLYLNLNFSPKVLLKQGVYDKNNIPKNVHQHYIKPFPTKASRSGLLNIGKALVGSSDWYQSQWEQINKISNKPCLILWGNKDKFITPYFLEKWEQALPKAKVIKFECGHFIQEEKTLESILEIERFLQDN